MAFGMKTPMAGEFAEIVKFDARAGRLFRIDYNPDTRQKDPIDITTPPPRFAIDFGSLQVGYAHFAATGPDYRLVDEGKPLPSQPSDKDAEGRLIFKPAFRVKIFGKVLNGLREWASSANVVMEAVDDLYRKHQAASEAMDGKIPIVELTKTIPVQMGRGARQSTVYTPCFAIVGWTDRTAEMGLRTVPPPLGALRTATATPAAAAPFEPQGVMSAAPLSRSNGGGTLIEDDVIPF